MRGVSAKVFLHETTFYAKHKYRHIRSYTMMRRKEGKNGKRGILGHMDLYVTCYGFMSRFNVCSLPLLFFLVGVLRSILSFCSHGYLVCF